MEGSDLLHAVSDSPFFQAMAEEDRVALAQLATLCEHTGGEILFRPRELPSALYLVVDGVAEISRRESSGGELEPVAYVGAGATLAASKVITGTPFEALARFPEGGHTLQWPRTVVLRHLYGSRAFGMHYLQRLARRVEDGFAHPAGQVGTGLGGRLDHFDLPTILQTVVGSGASGVLEVSDATGTKYGSIYTEDRRIGPMSCGPLSGRAAFFEILVTPPERGTFRFSGQPAPRRAGRRFELPPLLFEAARMQDEYRRFIANVPGQLELRTSGRQQVLSDSSEPELIDQIWRLVAVRPCGWHELLGRLPYSRSQVVLAVRDMLRAGMLVISGQSRAAGGVG
jgi:hypothetical protein